MITQLSDWGQVRVFCLFYFALTQEHAGVLVPQPGIKLVPPALGAWCINHQTTREILGQLLDYSVVSWSPSGNPSELRRQRTELEQLEYIGPGPQKQRIHRVGTLNVRQRIPHIPHDQRLCCARSN